MSRTTGTPDWYRVTAEGDGYGYVKTCEGWSLLVSYLKATMKREMELWRTVRIEKVTA